MFNLEIDFDRSHKGFLYDKKKKKKYLDFFGQYSTLTIGYNSEAFKKNFIKKKINVIFPQKIVNCELDTDVFREFRNKFKKKLGLSTYNNFHFCSTGALAVEAAIKTAIFSSKSKSKNIMVFEGSFHGINGYGGIFTNRFDAVENRLKNFLGNYIDHVNIDLASMNNGNSLNYNYKKAINNIIKKFNKYDYSAVLIEPIQSTYGDRYFNKLFFKELENLCNQKNIPLIFDEIQTGFYTSGKKWYFQHLNIKPDIVIFGKKSQVSGIMVKEKFSKIFKFEENLNVTWNSDVIDMFRSNILIEYIEKNNLLKNIKNNSSIISKFLEDIDNIYNVRSCGYIIAFDLKNKKIRNDLVKQLFLNGILVNPTRFNTIRLRPNLATTESEIKFFIKNFEKSLNEIKS